MKGLYKYLSPFAPDQSGAVSVLFELGGLIVICDAGGCAGNICGFDEPRWFTQKSAVFSAGLRDMDAIMGRDDRLLKKIGEALSQINCNFIALIGTPVPSVIGTDFKALSHIAEKEFGLPVLTVETTGMDLYDRGQEKAYMSLFQAYAENNGNNPPDIGIIGATPLDLLSTQSGLDITAKIEALGFGRAACYGMGSGLEDIKKAGAARCNIVVSPSGLKAAKWLMTQFGTPYVTGIPLTERGLQELKSEIATALSKTKSDDDRFKNATHYNSSFTSNNAETFDHIDAINNTGTYNNFNLDSKENTDQPADGILIIHQQFVADELRKELRSRNYPGRIDTASWFMFDESLKQEDDANLCEEDDLSRLLQQRNYKAIVGDPLFKQAIPDWKGEYFSLPHYAVSSGNYGSPDLEPILQQLYSGGR